MNISLSKKFKEFANDENKTMIIGLLTILVFLWLVIYLIPSFFVSLFDTFLGRIILVIIVILVGLNNYKYGLMLALILIIFTRFVDIVRSTNGKENFELSQISQNDFLHIQHTINPKIVLIWKSLKNKLAKLN